MNLTPIDIEALIIALVMAVFPMLIGFVQQWQDRKRD